MGDSYESRRDTALRTLTEIRDILVEANTKIAHEPIDQGPLDKNFAYVRDDMSVVWASQWDGTILSASTIRDFLGDRWEVSCFTHKRLTLQQSGVAKSFKVLVGEWVVDRQPSSQLFYKSVSIVPDKDFRAGYLPVGKWPS